MLYGKVCGGAVRKGIDPSIVGIQNQLTRVLTVIKPPDCGVLVVIVVDGCDAIMVVISGSNDMMDLTRLLDVLLASPVSSVIVLKVDDVWLRIACGHTPDGTK
ncbi:unnamed protein product [Lactuca saligna]|uniref:Uncharacterized protein n=1 Tax=Lactuca saligna TaxID=75948 RepID=A0AA36E539_LACSI|nr:unnamed protein product [Lactuca saligna]